MALDLSKLRRAGPQSGPSAWHYDSVGDSAATCDTAAYFNGAADRLKVKDIIFVTPSSGASGILVVNANSRDLTATPPVSGVVDTTSTTAIGSADSD